MSGTSRVSQYQKVHFAIFWIFWCKLKITQADAPTIWMDHIHQVAPTAQEWATHDGMSDNISSFTVLNPSSGSYDCN